MISKPKDYDQIPVGGEQLKPGGHKCVIMQVTEQVSSKGNQMLVVAIDTDAADTQPMYYQNRYLSDKRPDKKWSGNMYITVTGEYGPQNLKRFCTAVEDSNPGFVCWDQQGNLRMNDLKKRKVGIVFRGEDYTKEDGTVGFAVKGMRFCNYEKAFEQAVPEPKRLQSSPAAMAATAPASVPFQGQQQPDYGFVNVAEDDTEGLPFN